MGVEDAYSTSVRRLSWTESILHYNFSAYHLGTFSELEDSLVVIDIIKTSQKGLEKLTINQRYVFNRRYFSDFAKNEYWILMTSDGTDFVFGWSIANIDEANELYYRAKEIISIFNLSDIEEKVRKYKKWLFSLLESEFRTLKLEGYTEWLYAKRHIVRDYAEKHGLLDKYDDITQEGWSRVITEEDNLRLLNILLKVDYPEFIEWQLLNDFSYQFPSEIKEYIYGFFKRYSANFDANFAEIQSRRIQYGLAFIILRHIETDEKILEILLEHNKDSRRFDPFQERRILEKYINPIIAIIKNRIH
jgi:hypothetical protein